MEDVVPDTFEDEDRDISTRLNWVISYPKSGNTWVRLVARAYAGGNPDLGGLGRFGDVHPRVWHDVTFAPPEHLSLSAEVQIRPAALCNLAHLLEGKETLLKSHHGYYTVQGMDLWKKKWVKKVVNPVRDPRDVCCSVADHFGKTYEEAAEFMSRDSVHIGGESERAYHHFIDTWSKHVHSWLDSPLNVLTVRYEDMKRAPYQCFEEIMDFLLEGEADKERLEEAVDACQFEKLREREEEHGFPERSEKQDRFFRKGEAGGWKDELPDEVAAQVTENHAEMMEELGYLS